MSTLFNAEVDDVSGKEVTLTLVTVHPDAGPFEADKGFALRLIHETSFEFTAPFVSEGTCPLGDEITYKQISNRSWVDENASRFVSSVEVEPKDLPVEVPDETVIKYTIEVTDEKWIEHLKPGKTWESAAFA